MESEVLQPQVTTRSPTLSDENIWNRTAKYDYSKLRKLLFSIKIPTSKCSVEKLRLRLFHAIKMGLIESDMGNKDTKPYRKETKTSKLRLQKLRIGTHMTLPHPLKLEDWQSDWMGVTRITKQQIKRFLSRCNIHGTRETQTLTAARRLAVMSRRISGVEHHPISDLIRVCYIRGHVVPSARAKHRPYLVWVLVEKQTGAIRQADCHCRHGLRSGACLHILALLYRVAILTSKPPRHSVSTEPHKLSRGDPGDVRVTSLSGSIRCHDDMASGIPVTPAELIAPSSPGKTPGVDDLGHHLLNHQKEPIVFHNAISDWRAASWTPVTLQRILGDHVLRFRIGERHARGVQWETQCDYESATLSQFLSWMAGDSTCGALCTYDPATRWGYCDYKHMAQEFAGQREILKAVDWSSLGFAGRGGEKSTFWLGSTGAHTQCHYDTYGCNLVAQVYGRKRWVLFPPSDTCHLYPTRVPYEESSVFSKVKVARPDLRQHPEMKRTTPFVVTLEAGDVLYVPRHWWHDVTSLSTSLSINTWLELPEDNEERVREAVVRAVITAIMRDASEPWLNPTEELSSSTDNLQCLQTALDMSRQHQQQKNSDDFNKPESPSAGHCSCDLRPGTREMLRRAERLRPCSFGEYLALVEADRAAPPETESSPSDDAPATSLVSVLAESLSHPHVVQEVYQTLQGRLSEFDN